MHYYISPSDHPMLGNKVHDEAIEHLCKHKMLRPSVGNESTIWQGTDKLAAWIDALCSVPFPVTKYVVEWPDAA